ncbi:MAG: hypothetical protein HRU05_20340, partial [Oceanospirillaceae bacterium]|nr:hypothetical protein [Oceanospirillaceae bacterium]
REKLTDLQNKLARELGYNSFKHLLTQEIAVEKENLRKNAFKGKEPKDGAHIDFVNEHVAVYLREDGQRGLKALKNFDAGETLFTEKHYLYAGLSEVIENEGLPWTLTRNIIFKFPNAIEDMQHDGNFYPHFKPKLDSEDKCVFR